MKRRVGALLMALVLVLTGFAAYAEEGQPAELAVEDSIEDASVSEEEPVEGEDASNDEEPAAVPEETAEAAEPAAAPETTQSAEAEPEEQTTVPEETQSESATEPEMAEEAAETEESEEDIESYTALSGNLSVTVEAPKGALPENVLLYMQSVDEESDEYEEVQSYVQEGKEEEEKEASNLEIADIYFTLDGEKVDPTMPVLVKLDVSSALSEDANRSTLQGLNFADKTDGTSDTDTGVIEFETANLQIFAATWEDGQDSYEIATLRRRNGDSGKGNPKLTVDIEVTSEPNDGLAYQEGETITYKIKVTNTGDVDLTHIELNDNLTTTTPLLLGTLQPGDFTQTDSISYAVTKEDAENQSVTIKAVASGMYRGKERVFSGEETVLTEIGPRMTIKCEAKNTSEAYQEGDLITYTITVTNTGDVNLSNITVTYSQAYDSEGTWFIESLEAGESVSREFTYTVSEYDQQRSTYDSDPVITISASAVGEYIPEGKTEAVQSVSANSEDSVEGSIEVPAEPVPQKFVDTDQDKDKKDEERDYDDDGKEVEIDDTLVYLITYDNTDTEKKTVTIKDTFDKGLEIVDADGGTVKGQKVTWEIEANPQQKGYVRLTAKVKKDVESVVKNSASVKIGDNEASTNTVENPIKDKDPDGPWKSVNAGDGKQVSVGQNLEYTISFYNHHATSQTVTIRDELGEGLTYVSATKDGEFKSGTITWEMELKPFSTGEVTFIAKVNGENLTSELTGEEEKEEVDVKEDDDDGENGDGEHVEVDDTISYSYETVTYGEVENTAYVKIGDDEEKATNSVTNYIYSTSDSPGYGSGSGGEGSGENKAVNTADDTPVAPMAVLFGTALIVLGADIIYRRRRTQR